MAHSTAKRFKKEEKPSYDLKEDIRNLFQNYESVITYYMLYDVQQSRYLHNLSGDYSKTLYHKNIVDKHRLR